MILDSVVIENIRSYAHEEVEFSPGTSLFEGDIGSGKSTILMAIEFALFGLGSQKSESLLAKKENAGYVDLCFSVDGHAYEVRRTLKKTSQGISQNPKESWFKQDDVIEPLSPSEIKQRVLGVLGFNEPAEPNTESRIFRYAVFTPQEEMKKVLSDPKKRLETIRRAFQIEEYSTAHANANLLLADIRTRMAVMAGRFGNIPELESLITDAENDISAANARITEEQKKRQAVEIRIAEADSKLAALRKKDAARIRLESEITGLRNRINDKGGSVRQMEQDIEDYKNELAGLGAEHDDKSKTKPPETDMDASKLASEIKRFQGINASRVQAENEIKSTNNELARIRGELGDMDSDLGSTTGTLESLQEEKKSRTTQEDELRGKLVDARDQKTRVQAKKDGLEKEINTFTKLGNQCPTCNQPIDEQHGHAMVDHKKADVFELERKLVLANDAVARLTSELNETVERRRACENMIPKIQDAIRGIDRRDKLLECIPALEEVISGCDSQCSGFDGLDPVDVLGRLRDDLTKYELAASDIRRIEDAMEKTKDMINKDRDGMESARSQISDWQEELEENETELGSMEDDVAGMISEAESGLHALQEERASVVHDITVAETTAAGKKENVEHYKEQLAESKKLKAVHGRFSQTHEWLDKFFMPAVEEIEKQVLLDILQKFNAQYRDWYSMLVDDPTKESRIDENFTPVVDQDGYEQKVDFLSGGEKTSIALAYRLTLNSLVRDTDSVRSNLLILDEPTDGFSKDQLAKVQEILDGIDSEQIILVSHDRELENCADHVFQVSKHDGVSRVQATNRG